MYHPTISGLIRGGENHLMTKGRIRLVYTLDDSVTLEDMQNYIDYITADQPNVKLYTNLCQIQYMCFITYLTIKIPLENCQQSMRLCRPKITQLLARAAIFFVSLELTMTLAHGL